MYQDVCGQLLGNGELDQLLEKPASNRQATGLNPDVRSEANPQRVQTSHPDREHLLLRDDVRPVVLEGKEPEVTRSTTIQCSTDGAHASRLRLSNAQRSRSSL